MVQISKSERNFLVNNGFIKTEKGQYVGLKTLNRQAKSGKKSYVVEDDIAIYLKLMYRVDKVN